MRRSFAVVVACVFFFFASRVRADEPHPSVFLYTIGPSADFASRFGHAVLCIRPAGHDTDESGNCYDYGVADSTDMVDIGWTALRGKPGFVPVKVDERIVLQFFEGEQRTVERQRIPLTAEETAKLQAAVEAEVKERRAYAYHPYWANCTTKIRDHLDDASGGRLRPGPSSVPPGTLRELFEEGHTGRIGVLTAMAIYLGEGNDVTPTPWQAMLLPAVLRDGVTERFGVQPEKLTERTDVILPTSRALGRIVLFAVALALFGVVRVCARRGRLRLARGIVGVTLGVLALTVDLAFFLVTWTEIRHNWALALFWPTDLALPFLTGRRLAIYAKVRIGVAIALAVLEIANVAHQPLLPLVALVIFPFAGLLSAEKATRVAAAPAVAMKSAA